MKTRGDLPPSNAFTLEYMPDKPGYMLLQLFENVKKFTETNITAVNIVFTPGEDFQNLRSRAAFNPVASRIAQAATLKAEKAGQGTVDLDAAKGKTPAADTSENA